MDRSRRRTLFLAGPRGFCAGVRYAVDIVELALTHYGTPLYVRHEIIHNRHVCEDLRSRGVIFIDDVAEVPDGSMLVFSAHGVSPKVKAEASGRNLRVIDATCPLVSKVHVEVLRYAQEGYDILLIGHRGHVEVEGTLGHAPESTQVIETPADAEAVRVDDPAHVAVVTQTTLSVDDTRDILDVLHRRFPALHSPSKDDICYATQNRQTAVKELAEHADLILVIGSTASSNANRLVEVAEGCGRRGRLIESAADIEPGWIEQAAAVGLTAAASTPEALVQEAVARLLTLGCDTVSSIDVARETLTFPLPKALRNIAVDP